ncbi:predicted protein [Uncinocarpus reesii 1704]|uniref:Uncharacterized protein n=1 Tax=Uncinocarpus reesii (strain UAMH 1704) TaxID=336963 RepID=C4JV61_UNCRE|nr:uncharacterized protein UREG_06453 [Uncinocarpus reesii 1704]EEP81588.1 predicted protein [Uncinocarpus reesii 1704]
MPFLPGREAYAPQHAASRYGVPSLAAKEDRLHLLYGHQQAPVSCSCNSDKVTDRIIAQMLQIDQTLHLARQSLEQRLIALSEQGHASVEELQDVASLERRIDRITVQFQNCALKVLNLVRHQYLEEATKNLQKLGNHGSLCSTNGSPGTPEEVAYAITEHVVEIYQSLRSARQKLDEHRATLSEQSNTPGEQFRQLADMESQFERFGAQFDQCASKVLDILKQRHQLKETEKSELDTLERSVFYFSGLVSPVAIFAIRKGYLTGWATNLVGLQ